VQYSFVIPTFNRPDEVTELLESACILDIPKENFGGFEIIFADGSPTDILKPIIEKYTQKLNIQHLHKPKLAISPSRNLGAENAKGEYLIFLDSDVILPEGYLLAIHNEVSKSQPACFGGPDAAHKDFTPLQKAISFSMTSYFTTGGIRGGKKQIHKYNPRGFNMGIKKTVFEEVDGYSDFVCGEDIELSISIINKGYETKLIPDAFVYHKRRNTLKSFFRQVYRFGVARVNIFSRHPKELKITHLFPSAFFLFLVLGLLSSLVNETIFELFLMFISIYFFAIFINSTLQNRSLQVGFLSIITSVFQLCGYGLGFINNWFTLFILGKKEGLSLGASK
jgi:cellulose synthase/poly-beta-1,6-N-acetylglucosamine synthase-like glycosyltransferase